MCKTRNWLRVGLTTLVVSALPCVVLLSRATAGKPPPSPPPPVKYTMTLQPTVAMHTVGDVNNGGDFAGSIITQPGQSHAFVC